MTREEFFEDYIRSWEGGLSLDPDDSGNWFAAAGDPPVLVGSRYGVTGAALAEYRGSADISRADMAALTFAEAVRIGERLFYQTPGFDRLPWDPVVASAVDFGWGAGPREAVLVLQGMIGAARDGCLGDASVAAYRAFVARRGLPSAARLWRELRDGYYRLAVAHRPRDAKFLSGWLRRSAYYLPGTPWWRRFAAG